ncbi:DNA repair protein RecO [Mycoplasma putrefaciens]|uniref:DNA repair protein RecO n=1 Tax=Mycoplasma putrefaciens Mput9231 TaxID=1292033 RepID=M9WHH3_9MOLU|nr:DNA repair protein RecO [Mycoplasma putrefaciens]AGJ90834.1 DNA repair protein [Mycoplasma putrefaciens Mput9231]
MSEKHLQAIVIDSFDYQEFDKIITVYSDLYGKISFISLGVNKPTSKNKYAINYLSLSEFEIFKAKNNFRLSKLKKAVLINSHLKIADDLNLYLCANIITSLVNSLESNTKNFKLFQLLKFAIDYLETDFDKAFKVCVLFMFYFLKFLGFNLNLSKCGFCNLKSEIIAINFNHYCSVCKFCYFNDSILINKDLISFFKFIANSTFYQAVRKQISNHNLMILARFLLDFYQDQVGIFTNSMYQLTKYKEFDEIVFHSQFLSAS